jgi:hypothetical protein
MYVQFSLAKIGQKSGQIGSLSSGRHEMAVEGKIQMKEQRGSMLAYIQKATAEQLLEIGNGTALRNDPRVRDFNNANAPAFYQKLDDLRRLVYKAFKDHSDFQGMVFRIVKLPEPEQEKKPQPKQEKKPKE